MAGGVGRLVCVEGGGECMAGGHAWWGGCVAYGQ